MRQREHTPTEVTVQPPSPAPAPGGDQLAPLARQASELLAAAHSVIHAALSQNSEAFLQANRQHGGQ